MVKQRQCVDFDLNLLDDYASKNESLVTVQRSEYELIVHPCELNDLSKALKNHLRKAVSFYDEKLNGILLGYKNLKGLSNIGKIKHDQYFISFTVIGDFYVFTPWLGKCLNGTVVKTGKDHVTCSVYNCFTVFLPRPKHIKEAQQWIGDSLNVGDKVQFKIDNMCLDKWSTKIKGSILEKIKGTVNKRLLFTGSTDDETDVGQTQSSLVSQTGKKNKSKTFSSEDISQMEADIDQDLHQDESESSTESNTSFEVENSLEHIVRLPTNIDNSSTDSSTDHEEEDETEVGEKDDEELAPAGKENEEGDDEEDEEEEENEEEEEGLSKVSQETVKLDVKTRSSSAYQDGVKNQEIKSVKSHIHRKRKETNKQNSSPKINILSHEKLVPDDDLNDNSETNIQSIEQISRASGSWIERKDKSTRPSTEMTNHLSKRSSHDTKQIDKTENTNIQRNEAETESESDTSSEVLNVRKPLSNMKTTSSSISNQIDLQTIFKIKKEACEDERRNSLLIRHSNSGEQNKCPKKNPKRSRKETLDSLGIENPLSTLEGETSHRKSIEIDLHTPERQPTRTSVKFEKVDNSSKKRKKMKSETKRSMSLSLETTTEDLLNQILKVKKQEIGETDQEENEEEGEEDYSCYANMQLKHEEISLPDLDMDALLESRKLENSSIRSSSFQSSFNNSKVEMSEDSLLENLLAFPIKQERSHSVSKSKIKK